MKVRIYRALPSRLAQRAVRLATPNFTIGAIGLVTVDGTHILLVKPSYRTGWVPPGGFLDRGESPIDALERELAEELGLHLSFLPWHRVAFDGRRQSIAFVSVAVLPEAVNIRPRSPEILDAQWFPIDDLPPMPLDFFEGIPAEDLLAVRAAVRPATH